MTPYLYRTNVTTAGLTGAAEYNVQRRKFCRWLANTTTWQPMGTGIPCMNGGALGAENEHMDLTTATEVRHGQNYWGNDTYAGSQAGHEPEGLYYNIPY